MPVRMAAEGLKTRIRIIGYREICADGAIESEEQSGSARRSRRS
jgi:hypothetical protein